MEVEGGKLASVKKKKEKDTMRQERIVAIDIYLLPSFHAPIILSGSYMINSKIY